MDILDDKDVGELWRHCQVSSNPDFAFKMTALIRKLVEERAWRRWGSIVNGALRDFGIDPATYPGGEK